MLKKGVIVDSAPLLRVLAETKPTEEATIVSPTLEDYYLYVFWDAAGVR